MQSTKERDVWNAEGKQQDKDAKNILGYPHRGTLRMSIARNDPDSWQFDHHNICWYAFTISRPCNGVKSEGHNTSLCSG